MTAATSQPQPATATSGRAFIRQPTASGNAAVMTIRRRPRIPTPQPPRQIVDVTLERPVPHDATAEPASARPPPVSAPNTRSTATENDRHSVRRSSAARRPGRRQAVDPPAASPDLDQPLATRPPRSNRCNAG